MGPKGPLSEHASGRRRIGHAAASPPKQLTKYSHHQVTLVGQEILRGRHSMTPHAHRDGTAWLIRQTER